MTAASRKAGKQADMNWRPGADLPRNGVLTLSGYGLRVTVERGHLVTEDGLGESRRRLRLPRVSPGINRLVVLGHTGVISLEAFRCLRDVGITFVQIDADAQLLTIGATTGPRDSRIRRGQAIASASAAGVDLARELLGKKIEEQLALLWRLDAPPASRDLMQRAVDVARQAESIEQLRYIESRAAAVYWDAWHTVTITFPARAVERIPRHWWSFGGRSSALNDSPRKATSPANALLNYAYADLEAEAHISCQEAGCDPLLGIIHSDKGARSSLALDVMEAVRPAVDTLVLNLLDRTTFSSDDFFETREGVCRLMPELAKPLSETAPRWNRMLTPIVARAAQRFAAIARERSESKREMGRIISLLRAPVATTHHTRVARPRRGNSPLEAIGLPRYCRGCGMNLGKRRRTYCDACLVTVARDHPSNQVEPSALAGRPKDGRSSLTARDLHRKSAHSQAQAQREWEAVHDSLPSPKVFAREIAPTLQRVPARLLAQATGLSLDFCHKVCRGRASPHPMHWEALKAVAERHGAEGQTDDWASLGPALFSQEIGPRLARLTAREIQGATGLSASYSRRILHGHHVPHPRHWIAIKRLLDR